MAKKHIFKTAHKIAKGIVKEVGNYQIALQIALKEIYRQVKLYDKKRFGINAIESAIYRLGTSQEDKDFDRESGNYKYGVAKWFFDKEFTTKQRQALIKLEDEKIIKETEKAYKVAFFTEYGLFEKWIPKSVFKKEHANVSFAY
ncbi:hypothetical protein O3822_07265 [Gemella sanguinis]|uniref:hypothetical protein n=1 Tax=Gemella sanguinis TaxID=84135 RepID=UPI00352EE765